MKKFVKVLVAILVIAVLGVSTASLVACDDANTLYVVTNAQFPPFETMDGDKIVGMDVDFVNAIADELGMKVKIKSIEFDSIIGEIQNKKNAIGIAALTVNEERLKQISFTSDYYNSYQVFVVKADDNTFDGCDTPEKVNEVAKNKTELFAAQGQIGHYYIKGENGYDELGGTSKKTTLNTITDCMQKVEVNKSAAIADIDAAKSYVSTVSGYKIIDVALTEEKYAIGVNKKNEELLTKLNTAIKTLKDNGKLAEIISKWIK